MDSLERYRELFPVYQRTRYLDHAAISAPSTRVRDAMHKATEEALAKSSTPEDKARDVAATRAAVARLLAAEDDEIAFTRSTSHGLGVVAGGLSWSPGDEVLLCAREEFPANVYPWTRLADRGVVVRELAARDGGVDATEVARAMGPRTRVVAVSAVQWASGASTDLDALGALCRERGVLSVVDGMQSVGAMRANVRASGIDALATGAHKWILGMGGVGILYVARSLTAKLTPMQVGWRSTARPWIFDGSVFEPRTDASKLEDGGEPPYVLLAGLRAAVELLLEVGPERIEARVRALVARLALALSDLGCDVGPAPGARAGILSFTSPRETSEALAARLRKRGIQTSVRRGRVRVSPHFTNTDEDIDALVAVVADQTAGADPS